MNSMRKGFIEELMMTLKIPKGTFNYSTIEDEIKHIPNNQLKDFYKSCMTADSFGNGMKAIISVAKLFKPIEQDDTKEKARKIISFVEALNSQISEEAKAMGEDFVKMVDMVKLPSKYDRTLAVMDLVKPYMNAKELIINIRHYRTSSDALNAVILAIKKYNEDEIIAISNPNVRKMLQGVKK